MSKCSGILYSHKEKEIVIFVTTWMKLDGMMLSEISHLEKDKCCIISFICGILKKKAHRKRDHIGGCQGQGCVEVREASESGQKV